MSMETPVPQSNANGSSNGGGLKKKHYRGRYCVVMPAFNTAETVGKLVEQVKQLGLDAIVVDDGSQDKTAEAASKNGAVVISHLVNRGKGLALRSGFDYAKRQGYDGIITMDSDGQHDPAEIDRLIQAGELQHAGLVLGNRMADEARMPFIRRRTNRFMSWLISSLIRQPVPDSQCGLRMIRREVLEQVPLHSEKYEIESELLLSAGFRHWKIISVPIQTIYNGGQSHIHPLRDSLRFFGLVLKCFLLRR